MHRFGSSYRLQFAVIPGACSSGIAMNDSPAPDDAQFFRDLRDRAETCLAKGDLPKRRGTLRKLPSNSYPAVNFKEDVRLRVTLNYAIVRLRLGHYDEASNSSKTSRNRQSARSWRKSNERRVYASALVLRRSRDNTARFDRKMWLQTTYQM